AGGKGLDGIRNVGCGVVRELALTPLHRPPLNVEIELTLEAALKLAGQSQRSVRHQEGKPALGKLRQVLENVQIGLDHPGDVRPSNLQRNGAAVAEHCAVDLGDRGRRYGLRIERQEDFLQRLPVVLGQNLLDLAK